MISAIFFALMMMIKGGWHWHLTIWRKDGRWIHLEDLDRGVLGFFLDGSRLSTITVLIVVSVLIDPLQGLAFALAWFIGNIASMGEEAGAIGPPPRGPYIENGFGQRYGVLKGLQRGIYLGALLTLSTFVTEPSPWFIVAGASFPVCYFAGQSLQWKIHKTTSWAYAEPIYGAVIGIAAWYWLGG